MKIEVVDAPADLDLPASRRRRRPCEVMESRMCSAHMEEGTRARCFACGLPACTACSIRLRYHRYGTQRVCTTCVPQHYENGEAVLAWFFHREAGYKVVRPRPRHFKARAG